MCLLAAGLFAQTAVKPPKNRYTPQQDVELGRDYVAHPSGQPSAEFRSTTVERESVVFENPGHDFPQRIGYRREGMSLLAWIEGTRDGKPGRIEFPYQRVPCPGD